MYQNVTLIIIEKKKQMREHITNKVLKIQTNLDVNHHEFETKKKQ